MDEANETHCKILFLAANPMETEQLALGEEARDIEAKIRSSDYRNVMTLQTRWAVRPDDLLQALLEDRPTIVHFSGHGSGASGIVLQDDGRHSKFVTANTLKQLFTALKDNIRVVVLNACYSTEQAEAIVEVIDCVIGMSSSVGDEAARKFSASFYRGIGFGRSVKNAFDQGRVSIDMEDLGDENVPKLLARGGVNADEVFVVQPMGAPRADRSVPIVKASNSAAPASVTLRMESARLVDEGAIWQALRRFGRSWPDVAIEWPPSVQLLIEGLKAGINGPLTAEGGIYFAAHVPPALTRAEDCRVRVARLIPDLIQRSSALSDRQLFMLLSSMLLFGNYHAHTDLAYHAGWNGLAPWKTPPEWESLRLDHTRSKLASLLGDVYPNGIPHGRLIMAAGKLLYGPSGSPGHYVFAPEALLEHPDEDPDGICKWLIPQLEIEMSRESLPSSYMLTGWRVDKVVDADGMEKR